MNFNYKVVFIIPVKNEEKNILKLIKKIFTIEGLEKISVIFIDDKSSDKTVPLIKEKIAKNKNIYLLERNIKKFFNQRGSALIDGIKYLENKNQKFDYYCELDGDLSHEPKEVIKGINELQEKKADISIGSKYLKNSEIINRSEFRNSLSMICKVVFSLFFSLGIKDFTNGYRIYSNKVAVSTINHSFNEEGPLFLVESLLFWKKQSYKIIEFPSSYFGREEGNSKLNFFDYINYLFKMIILIFNSRL